MKRIMLLVFPVVFLTPLMMSGAELPSPPASGYYVVDDQSVISTHYEKYINSMCREIELVTKVHISVVTISGTNGTEIEDYSRELSEFWWKEKEASKGILLVAAMDDRRVYTYKGDEASDALADKEVSRIYKDVILPNFRDTDYGEGLYRAVRLYAREIEKEYDVDFESVDDFPDDLEEEVTIDDSLLSAACWGCWWGWWTSRFFHWDIWRHRDPDPCCCF